MLRLFSVAGRIESPSDVTLEGLHLETFVPADDRTRQLLQPGQARASRTARAAGVGS